MKYQYLLKLLSGLIYIKRAVWFMGPKIGSFFGSIFNSVFKFFGYFFYRFEFLAKKVGRRGSLKRQLFRRDNMQIGVLLLLFILAIPQTKIYGKTENFLPGKKSIAYELSKDLQEFDIEIEEITASENTGFTETKQSGWRAGTVSTDEFVSSDFLNHDRELASSLVAGGTAVTKPIIFPGTFVSGKRTETIGYVIQDGDTISGIAFKFGVSVATILWENNLSATSYIQPGDSLNILPISGITHKAQSGDSLISIASSYGGKIDEIATFNNLEEDGSDLKIGQRVIIPNGVKVYSAPAITTIAQNYYTQPSASTVSIPPSSASSPSASGFVWPSAMRIITQYYSWYHQALDISGPIGQARGSAIYASKTGTVETSQCGWNMGYGCYVVIDHGGGYKTLYGHNSQLLVSAGQRVTTGQTIALMGNTGRVYGYDGTHTHFEIRINGARVNPLNYVK